jgi:hypothetical protein
MGVCVIYVLALLVLLALTLRPVQGILTAFVAFGWIILTVAILLKSGG